MRKLKFVLSLFATVNASVLIACAVFTTIITPTDAINPMTLWQIPFVSLLCSCTALVHPWDTAVGKTKTKIHIFVQYLLINLVVLGAGGLFQWYDITDFKSVFSMIAAIALIFAGVSEVTWKKSAKVAQRMNEKLKEYNSSN